MLSNDTNIKWSQWTPMEGMIRCGRADYGTLMNWMQTLGKAANEAILHQEKDHCIYGRKMYDENDQIKEIRFYLDTFMTDDEVIDMVKTCPRDYIFATHK